MYCHNENVEKFYLRLSDYFGNSKVKVISNYTCTSIYIFSGNHKVTPKVTIDFNHACNCVEFWVKFKDCKYTILVNHSLQHIILNDKSIENVVRISSIDYDNCFQLITEYFVKE